MSVDCPVCKVAERAEVLGSYDSGNISQMQCGICGRYEIGKMAAFALRSREKPATGLSAWIRAQNLREIRPKIVRESLDEILRDLPTFLVSDRSIELLKALAVMSKMPGKACTLQPSTDYPLAWGEDADELSFHLQALQLLGFIRLQTVDADNYSAMLLSAGWNEVERGRAALSDRAFVAMSFSEAMKSAWFEGFGPAIKNAGYLPHRVDSEPHNERIDQKIIADIRGSRFVIADVTEQKNGVYFEAGFALGAGKPVLWTVREDELTKVHFDTRQFAHVVWKEPGDLASQLCDVIKGILGKGPRPID